MPVVARIPVARGAIAAALALALSAGAAATPPTAWNGTGRGAPQGGLGAGARALLREMADTPAPSGAEGPMLHLLARGLRRLAPAAVAHWDSLGNLSYRFPSSGSGGLKLLIVTPVDQPGFVVSRIRPDGYLRIQPVTAGRKWPSGYPKLLFANAATILTAQGPVAAVGAGISVHLLPTRSRRDVPGYGMDDLYLDTGAASAAEDAAAGIRLLDPVVLETRVVTAPGDPVWVGAAMSSRAAIPALAALVADLARRGPRSGQSIGIAFATERYFGHHGLERLVQEYQPEALVLVLPGEGPGWSVSGNDARLLGRWQAASQAMPLQPAPQLARQAGPNRRYLLIRVPVGHLHSAAELLDTRDAARLQRWLGRFACGAAAPAAPLAGWTGPKPAAATGGVGGRSASGWHRPSAAAAPVIRDLRRLVAATGVSGSEGPVRRLIRQMLAGELPTRATETIGPAGDLIVAWGPPRAARSLLFIAHMDEIGWRVQGRLPDGTLALQPEGYGLRAFYARHVVLVHTAGGAAVPGELRFQAAPASSAFAASEPRRAWLPRLDLGLTLAQEDALGIGLGDAVAVPKVYRPLLDGRASARSFDDRVGDAALVAALGRLRAFAPRDRVYFVWSTGEELGLLGAKALARRLHPTCVFALDTFVSSDSPLEDPRFADAPLGQGLVIRAVDNSIIMPAALVRRVRAVALAHHIPVQVGVTGGGNDGSAFLRYGSQVAALGWPLRYSHSPAEVVDTRDVRALTRMVEALVRRGAAAPPYSGQ